MKIKQRELNESLRKERGKLFYIFGDKGQQKSLRKENEKKREKKKKYIYKYKLIELLATTLTASTS